MAFTTAHNVLQVIGDLSSAGDKDAWSFSLRFAEGVGTNGTWLVDGTGTNADGLIDLMLDDIEADLRTWWTAVGGAFPSSTRILAIKFNAVDTFGRLINQVQTVRRDFASPMVGGGATPLPPQLAEVVTFRTDASRGLASRGRIYLPALAHTAVDGDGRISGATCANLANSTAQLLTNLSDWPTLDASADPGRVCVMSSVREGATRRVNRVDVGDVFDTQRRRANALGEVRTAEVQVAS